MTGVRFSEDHLAGPGAADGRRAAACDDRPGDERRLLARALAQGEGSMIGAELVRLASLACALHRVEAAVGAGAVGTEEAADGGLPR